jgi:hypothetical protein
VIELGPDRGDRPGPDSSTGSLLLGPVSAQSWGNIVRDVGPSSGAGAAQATPALVPDTVDVPSVTAFVSMAKSMPGRKWRQSGYPQGEIASGVEAQPRCRDVQYPASGGARGPAAR